LNVWFVIFRFEVFGYVFIYNIDQIKVSTYKKTYKRYQNLKISKFKTRALVISS
jgi:hypothetical protein